VPTSLLRRADARPAEFLSSLDLDPDALYPCVPDLSGD